MNPLKKFMQQSANEVAALSEPSADTENREKKNDQLDHNNTEKRVTYVANRFVRRDGEFYETKNLGGIISATDVKRVSFLQASKEFPEIKITDDLWSAVCLHAISDTHTAKGQSVAVWNGKQACLPSDESGRWSKIW